MKIVGIAINGTIASVDVIMIAEQLKLGVQILSIIIGQTMVSVKKEIRTMTVPISNANGGNSGGQNEKPNNNNPVCIVPCAYLCLCEAISQLFD